MANTTHIFGFRPSNYFDGTTWNGQTHLYGFSSSQANNVYKGDVVAIDTTNRATALADVYAPQIPVLKPLVAAMTTTAFRRIVVGFVPEPENVQSATASLGLMYRKLSTARYGWVIDDTNVVFEVEEKGTNSYVSDSNNGVNKGVDITYTAGNTTTGIAAVAVDGGTIGTTQLPFRLLWNTRRPDNWNYVASDSVSKIHWDVTMMNSDLGSTGVVTVGA